MLSKRVSDLLLDARLRRGLTQSELAARTNVSTRLVAELERGLRPNASLETVLSLLYELGVTLRFTEPGGAVAELPGRDSAALAREARAQHRRQTWTGTNVALEDSGVAPSGGRSVPDRLAAVSRVSRQAHVVARAGATRTSREPGARGASRAATGSTASAGRSARPRA